MRVRLQNVAMDAEWWDGTSERAVDIVRWIRRQWHNSHYHFERDAIVIQSDEGILLLPPGDWVVKDRGGSFHVVSDAAFKREYENDHDDSHAYMRRIFGIICDSAPLSAEDRLASIDEVLTEWMCTSAV